MGIRYCIERWSPSRKEWIDFNEHFENKAMADDRLITLVYRHRREPDMKFRIVEKSHDPEKLNKESRLKELKTIGQQLKEKINELKKDPKKEALKSINKELKQLEQEQKALVSELESEPEK